MVIGEVTAADRGYSYKSSDYGEDGLGFVTLKAIDESGHIRADRLKSLTDAASATSKATAATLACGDVLLAMTDLTPDRRIIGMPIVVGEAEAGMVFSMDLLRLKVDNEHLVDKFLGYCLARNEPRAKLRSMATGTTVGHLGTKAALSIEVPAPALSEQRRIVAVLEQADRAVEAAARHVANTEALLKAMIDTEVGRVELPDKWALRPLEQIVTQKNDWGRVTPDAAYRLLGVRVRGAGAYDRGAIVGAKTKYPKFNVAEAGDLVLSKIWARNGAIAVIDSATSGCSASPEFPLFSPHQNEVLSSWLRLYMSLPRAWEECERLAKGTSGQNRITPAQFLRMEIPLPPLAEQQAIVARIEKVEAAVRAAKAHLERLRALRSSLLENLVSGRVRLPMLEATASEAAA